MNVTKNISDKIAKLPIDITFGYADLSILSNEIVPAAKVLERLQKKGVIRKLSKGIFYKPKKTVFGELKPTEKEILKSYLFKNDKRIAYITGTYLYNQMNLTTQIPSVLKIASATKRIYIKRETVRAKPVKSYVPVTEENYKFLGLLDALKDLNTIPDVNKESAIIIFLENLKKMPYEDLLKIKELGLLYPPRVRALLGSLLEQQNDKINITRLRDSLNPLTTYKYNLKDTELTTYQNWNII